MYQYLLFDADNTLLDFDLGERTALRQVLMNTPLGWSEEIGTLYHNINDNEWKLLEQGLTTRERIKTERYEKLFAACGCPVDAAAAAEVADAYVHRLAEQAQLIDGALEIVRTLAEKYAIYIITNGTDWIQYSRIRRTPLLPYIKKTYVSHEMGCAKPERVFFDKVLADIGDDRRERYLVIGDSLTSDVAGARGAELDCCYYDPHGHGPGGETPKWTIRSLGELLHIL